MKVSKETPFIELQSVPLSITMLNQLTIITIGLTKLRKI